MTQRTFWLGISLMVFFLSPVKAQEYSVEKIDGGPQDAEGVSEEIAKQLSDHGFRVKRDGDRTVSEVWLTDPLKVDPDFQSTPTRLYPFTPGQLIGVLHFPRRGSEFRDQTVSSGWYTLRFGLQPIDGNHIGTSPTRDFLLLVEASQDEFSKDWDEDQLNEASAEAAGSSHPAMLCLQFPSDASETTIRKQDLNDWWIVHTVASGEAGGESKQVPIDIVVAGHAAE